jgi:hypothetical protein
MASRYKRDGWYYLAFFESGRQPQRRQVALKTRSIREAEREKVRLEDEYGAGRYDPWNLHARWSAVDLGTREGAGAAFLASRSHLSLYTVWRRGQA